MREPRDTWGVVLSTPQSEWELYYNWVLYPNARFKAWTTCRGLLRLIDKSGDQRERTEGRAMLCRIIKHMV